MCRAPANHSNESVKKLLKVGDVSHHISETTLITPHLYAYHQYTSVISSNVHANNVSQCHLQSHLPVRDTTHTLSDSGYMHFIIGNVTGEHLQRCHNLITVCKYDTAVGRILNTNAEEDFSCHICTLSDSVVPVGEIAVSTTICFYIILRGYFTQEMWATWGGAAVQGSLLIWSQRSLLLYLYNKMCETFHNWGIKITKRHFPWRRWLWPHVK